MVPADKTTGASLVVYYCSVTDSTVRSPQFSLAYVGAPTAFEFFSNPEPKGG